jgi:hypothetical protein
MHLLSQKPNDQGDVLVVAFGRREDRPEKVWALSFGLKTIQTVVRSGKEVAFTGREEPAPALNSPDQWIITLFLTDDEAAIRCEEKLRSLKPQVLFHGDDGLSGIVARGGHSMQTIGVNETAVELLAYRHGAKARLMSSERSLHRDYYLLPVE